MDLPIDHFRLLGVSPATDVQSVLRILEQRLDRPPDQGFTLETLQARAELLRSSADLLTDPERRQTYESELTALNASGESLQAALDVPATKEVAGLVLLLEAGMALDAFELASRALQPPQAPALGSGREADLSLVAGLACLEAARDLRQERRYEAGSQVLAQGNQLLQRVGQHGGLRQQMADERRTLRPYRVLDLLSRDLSANQERGEGLALLEELVEERGGLDGHAGADLSSEEFQAFFQQIRAYLTVQEQIELLERWAPRSTTADFLAARALTALGFAQRKPERIAEARGRLLLRNKPEFKPLLACLNLLLGQVDTAEFQFADGASEELRNWAARQSDEPLAQVCAYCRDWLARDVLPGYRDLEADADLEAYFADRDVQTYLDDLEPGDASAPQATTGKGGSLLGGGLRSPFSLAGAALPGAQALLGFGPLGELSSEAEGRHAMAMGAEPDDDGADDDELEQGRTPRGWRRPALLVAGALATVLLALGLVARLRPTGELLEPAASEAAGEAGGKPAAAEGEQPTDKPTQKPAEKPTQKPAEGESASTAAKPSAAAAAIPLRNDQPNPTQIQTLLETWLAAKASVLAGDDPPAALDDLAQDSQLRQLQAERRSDQARNHTQRIETDVQALKLESSSPQRISAVVTLRYRGTRLNEQGEAVGQASNLQLRNRYVFSRDGNTWRVVSFQRVN